jgi:hypothetical protein
MNNRAANSRLNNESTARNDRLPFQAAAAIFAYVFVNDTLPENAS